MEPPVDNFDLDIIVGTVGNLYTRYKISPPFKLRAIVKSWRGLTLTEIVSVLERHFEEHARQYSNGAAEQWFGLVHEAIRKAWRDKHPLADHEVERPSPRKRTGIITQVPRAVGADAIDDRDDGLEDDDPVADFGAWR